MPNIVKFTSNRRAAFIDHLRETCNVTLAARSIGMSRRHLYDLRTKVPDFAAEWDEAIQEGIDLLEAEAHRRAFQGDEVPIVSRGQIVTSMKRYSDRLAMFLLKTYRPDKYRDRAEVEHIGNITFNLNTGRHG